MLGKNFTDILSTAQSLPANITVFFLLHDEDVESNKVVIGKKVKTVGSLVDNHFAPLELVNIALWAMAEHTKDGLVHHLYTQETIVDGIKYPAKSPEGMFDELTIPNDYQLIVDKINGYY